MSIKRRRAGRKAYATYLQYNLDVHAACVRIGNNVRAEIELHGGLVERTVLRTPMESYMKFIDREADRQPVEMSESRAYVEIDRAFSPLGDLGASAALGLILDSGAQIFTSKAIYQLKSRQLQRTVSSLQENLQTA